MSAVLDYINRHGRPRRGLSSLPPIECADGFRMSVQVGRMLYCTPRDDDGPWTEVEVGFPTAAEPDLLPYMDGEDDPTQCVYGYVPFEIVDAIIARHGGIRP